MSEPTDAVSVSRHGSIAVIEMSNPPVNAINLAIRVGLGRALDQVTADPRVKAILLVSTGRIFMAGMDISEFDGPPHGPSLQSLQSAIEHSSKPFVVAMQGLTLGGGLELAMACHFRIALAQAQLGMPEISLGLIPGAGGTQRLPRLVGQTAAFDLMLSGAPVSAEFAKQIGLLDSIVEEPLQSNALAFCEKLLFEGREPRRTSSLTAKADLDAAAVASALKKHARTTRGLTAPQLLTRAVEASSLAFSEGLAKEAALAATSLQLRESLALRHLFFAERAAGKIAGQEATGTVPELRHVAVIGAGTMGSGIAMAFADSGLKVTLIDNAQAGLDRGMKAVELNYATSIKRGRLTPEAAAKRVAAIHGSTSLQEAAACDVVVEAVFEDLAIKKQVLGALDALVPADKLIASNTSTLSVTELARSTAHPERVTGLHFFSPAHIMKLLEVIRGADTSAPMLSASLQVARLLKKIGVVANDGFGFIGNRMMLDGYFREAEQLLLEGASPSDVDTALERFGFAMGPQRVSDLGGTDVGTKARLQLYQRESRPDPYFVIADRLTALGRLGQKSSAGFYRYEAGGRDAKEDPEVQELIEGLAKERGIVRRRIDATEIVERCVLSLIHVGAMVLEEKVASRASDIDVVWTSGYGFPRYLGGPMFYADTLGLKHVSERIHHFHERYGHYWKPTALIDRLARDNKTFEQWDKEAHE